MRRVGIVLLFGAVVAGSSSEAQERVANNPLVTWQGTVFFTGQNNPACSTIGNHALAVFRPRLDPAEPESALFLYFERSAVAMRRTGGAGSDKMHGAGTYDGIRFNTRAEWRTGLTGNYSFALVPQSPLATTNSIALAGTITNWDGQAGCNVTVRGSFARRP